MATNALTTRDADWTALEKVVVQGDLAKLPAEDRVLYYRQVCESTGLNPFTKPFDYIALNGKLTLYATRNATDQLRAIHGISVQIVAREFVDDLYVVTARATLPDGRTDESIGAVTIGGLKGEARANALMKAETKAKRRVTLSVRGLSFLDETEVESIPSARRVRVDEDGVIEDMPARAVVTPISEAPQGKAPMDSHLKRLWITAREHGWDEDTIKKAVRLWYPYAKDDAGNVSTKLLTREHVEQLTEWVSEHGPEDSDLENAIAVEEAPAE